MPLGAIVVREPQSDAFRGLENLLSGAAGGFAKREKRDQLLSSLPQDKRAAFSQFPTEILEAMARQSSQQQLMQQLNPTGFAAQQQQQQLQPQLTQSQIDLNQARSQSLSNPQPRPTRGGFREKGQFDRLNKELAAVNKDINLRKTELAGEEFDPGFFSFERQRTPEELQNTFTDDPEILELQRQSNELTEQLQTLQVAAQKRPIVTALQSLLPKLKPQTRKNVNALIKEGNIEKLNEALSRLRNQ